MSSLSPCGKKRKWFFLVRMNQMKDATVKEDEADGQNEKKGEGEEQLKGMNGDRTF